MKKLTFWLGISMAILGPLVMLAAWFYMNQTVAVPSVTSYVPPGGLVSLDNVDFTHKYRLPDVPSGLISKQALQSHPWRAIDGIYPTDPLTYAKLSDVVPLKFLPGQVIASFPFNNTGLLTFIQPGDRITITDIGSAKTVLNVLVLATYDKESNAVAILPALQGIDRPQAQGLLKDAINGTQKSQTVTQSPCSLLLQVTSPQALDIAQMQHPFVELSQRLGLLSPSSILPRGGKP